MMRLVDALLSIPTLFLALVVVSMFPPTERELILVIALTSWLTTSRLIRGEALSLRVRDYVQAMRVMGGGSARAVFRHIAPNAIGTIVVNATFQVADAILLVVALSYLGLGIRPPQTDWGGMLNAGINSVYDGYWWQIFPAGIAIILVVIAINFVGDALRDCVRGAPPAALIPSFVNVVVCSCLGDLLAPLLDIQDLHTEIRLRRATVHAIDGVSLSVAPGECLGIVGESGSGKTMTALSIMRLLPGGGEVTGGRIMVDGTDVARLSETGMEDVRGNLIGMIFQDPLTSLNPTMTIGDQIAESVRIHRGASHEAALARAVEVLGLVGMPRPAERVSQFPHQLSGGMRQRVMIAMALACEPKLLIADEPTTALDVTIQKQILELIDSLRRRLSMAVILVTHDLGVIAGTADRVAVMYAGRIVETAPTTTLFANPRHPYTEALFDALPERAAAAAAAGTGSGRLYNIPGQPPDLTDPPRGCKFAARCRYAQDSCRETEPLLTDAGGKHAYRCFFPVGRGVDPGLEGRSRRSKSVEVSGASRDRSVQDQIQDPRRGGPLGSYFRRRSFARPTEISPSGAAAISPEGAASAGAVPRARSCKPPPGAPHPQRARPQYPRRAPHPQGTSRRLERGRADAGAAGAGARAAGLGEEELGRSAPGD